jgi:hypothetical protein
MLPNICCAISEAQSERVFQLRAEIDKLDALSRMSWSWFHQVPGADKLPKPTSVAFYPDIDTFLLTWRAGSSSVTVQCNDRTATLLVFDGGRLDKRDEYVLPTCSRLVHDLLECAVIRTLQPAS